MRKAPEHLLSLFEKLKPLKKAEELALIRLAQEGDNEARELLLKHGYRWIWKQAAHYSGSGIPAEDLFQVGVIGFIQAIECFDKKYGVRLLTYAAWKVRQQITMEIHTRRVVITLPQKANRTRSKTIKDQADKVLNGLQAIPDNFSDSQLNTLDDLSFLEQRELRRHVRYLMRKLSRLNRIAFYLRLRGWKLTRIAKVVKRSPERVRVMCDRSSRFIKDAMQHNIDDYL